MIYSIQDNEDLQRANSLFDKINESSSNKQSQASKVEFVKQNGDITFGVIKEHGVYTVKASRSKNSKIIAEDFNYIKGFQQRKSFQRGSLQEAIKLLHLYINEEKYVVDVPLPDNYGQESAPIENTPQVPEMPLDQQRADSGANMPVNNADAPMDDVEGAVDGGTDQQKEMQQLTGTLAQDLRTEIQKDNAQFTVGMFKSIIAAAKDLPQEQKQEVLNKAQEVLNGDKNAEQEQPSAPEQQQAEPPMPTNGSVNEAADEFIDDDNYLVGGRSKEVKGRNKLSAGDRADIAALNAKFIEKLKAHPANRDPKDARQLDFKPMQGQISAREAVDMMINDLGDLYYCDDYKEMVHKEKGAVRFITGYVENEIKTAGGKGEKIDKSARTQKRSISGKYDLFIFYWSSVDDKNYDVYVVDKKDVANFTNADNHLQHAAIAKRSVLDVNYDYVKKIATEFLSSEKKIMDGTLSASKMSKALLDKNEHAAEDQAQLDESVKKNLIEFDDYDDDVYSDNKPVYMKTGARDSNKISWKDVYEILQHNTKVLSKPFKKDQVALNTGDFEDDDLLNRAELDILENYLQVIELFDNVFPVFSQFPDVPTYDEFLGNTQAIWDKEINSSFKSNTDTSTRDKQRYFSGSEGSGGF